MKQLLVICFLVVILGAVLSENYQRDDSVAAFRRKSPRMARLNWTGLYIGRINRIHETHPHAELLKLINSTFRKEPELRTPSTKKYINMPSRAPTRYNQNKFSWQHSPRNPFHHWLQKTSEYVQSQISSGGETTEKPHSFHHFFVGVKRSTDRLLFHRRIKKNRIPWKVVEEIIYFPEWHEHPRGIIDYIQVKDLIGYGNGGFMSVLEGGVGLKRVTLEFTSQEGKSFDFLIYVFGHSPLHLN